MCITREQVDPQKNRVIKFDGCASSEDFSNTRSAGRRTEVFPQEGVVSDFFTRVGT
jgi:hypothetical protein